MKGMGWGGNGNRSFLLERWKEAGLRGITRFDARVCMAYGRPSCRCVIPHQDTSSESLLRRGREQTSFGTQAGQRQTEKKMVVEDVVEKKELLRFAPALFLFCGRGVLRQESHMSRAPAPRPLVR